MNHRILVVAFHCCLFVVSRLSAQPSSSIGKIEGTVTDIQGRAIPSVTVSIQSLPGGGVADEHGWFSIEIPSGEYVLVFRSMGYTSQTLTVAVSDGETKQLSVQLEESVRELNTVVTTATRSERELENLPVPVTVIPAEQIRSMGSLRLNDVLAEQTGLAIVNDHGTGVQVQGFNPEYTLILVDGEPIIGRTAGTLELNRIAVGNIEQVEIVKGPASSLYGSEALAGVVNIITKKPRGSNVMVSTRYGTNSTADMAVNGNYEGKKTGVYAFINRYSTGGYDLTKESIGNTVEPFVNTTFTSRLTFSPAMTTKISLSGRYFMETQDMRVNTGTSAQPAVVTGNGDVKDWNINFQATHRFSNKFKATLRSYSTGYRTFSVMRYQDNGATYDESFFEQTFYRPEFQAEYFFNTRHIITMGVGRIWESVEATRYTDKKSFASNYYYFQHEWMPYQKLNITAGGRYDAHSAYRAQFSPKLSLEYKAVNWLSLRASAGVGFKAPDFRQLYLNFTNAVAGYSVFGSHEVAEGIRRLQEEGQISDVLMDLSAFSELNAENSVAYNIGFRLNPSSVLSSIVNFFHNDIQDLLQTQAVARKTNGQSVFSYFNLKEVSTRGVETDLSYTAVKYCTFSFGYQYLVAKDKSVVNQLRKGEVYARDPQTQATFRVSEKDYGGLFNRSRHTVNAKLFYQHPAKGWSGSVRTIYRGRYGFGDRNNNTILDTDSEYVDGYITMNLSVARSIRNVVTIQAGCDNLFNYTDPDFITALPGRLIWGSLSVTLAKRNTTK